jgi:prepilin peptidase CpaA
MASSMMHPFVLLFFPGAMALAASMDLLTMTIPNRLSLALAIGYIVLALAAGVPAPAILYNLSCGLVVLALTFGLFTLGWIGGGDAKLAAATAMWLGWSAISDYGLSSAIYGGVLTFAVILGRKVSLPGWMSAQGWIARLHDARTGIPYGIALAAAGIMVYPRSQLWQALSVG